MDQSPSTPESRPLLPWLALTLVIIMAAGGAFWLNQKIDAAYASMAPRQESDVNETKQAVANLRQVITEIQTGQQTLGEQVSQLQRAIATNQGERKLLSDQLNALSSRVDGLASSRAEGGSAAPQQPPSTNRRRR